MTYGFVERVDDIINSVGFDLLPLSTGDFGLHTQHVISSFEAVTNFNQIINEDLEGYSYKLIDTDDGFFKVESMDTIQQIVKGRFQAKFKRTSKNGNKDLGLSKILLFQGVFNEHYEVK